MRNPKLAHILVIFLHTTVKTGMSLREAVVMLREREEGVA